MKLTLRTILIVAGIIIWLSIAFFIYTYRYSKAAQQFSFHSEKNYEDYESEYFSKIKRKLTLILLKNDTVFGYYGNSINDGKLVPIDEIDSLIQGGWKMFSKDSLVVFIKQTKDAGYKATVDVLDKMSTNQIKNYTITVLIKDERNFLKIE